jgi:hypothetical protein
MRSPFQMNTRHYLPLIAFALLAVGCKKEFDAPPLRTLPQGQVLTVAELRSLFQGEAVRFGADSSVYAVVTADEGNGNLYRNIFVQDHTGAIQLRLQNPGGLYQGDSIRIYLPGTILSSFSGMLQLDSVDVDNNVVKQATLVPKAPTTVTIPQLSTMQGMLIRLQNVEFVDSDLGLTYANAVAQQTQNRTLRDCNGNTVLVRTSGFADFAAQLLPSGNGSFVAVVGQFNNDMQLFIRNINEVQLNGPRCDGGGGGDCEYDVDPVQGFTQDFSDVLIDNQDYANPNWLNINEQGNRFWRGRIFGGTDKYLRATGFAGAGVTVPPTEIWLVTPPVTAFGTPNLNFRTAKAFWTHTTDEPFAVYISTDFDGCEVGDATWTEITGYNKATSSNSDYQWVQSGAINLVPFLPAGFTGNFHVGFRYYAVGTQTSTFDLDDISIQQ